MIAALVLLGLVFVVAFALGSFTRRPLVTAFAFMGAVIALIVGSGTNGYTVPLLAGGLVIVSGFLVESAREVTHEVAVARRERRRRRRRRPVGAAVRAPVEELPELERRAA